MVEKDQVFSVKNQKIALNYLNDKRITKTLSTEMSPWGHLKLYFSIDQ